MSCTGIGTVPNLRKFSVGYGAPYRTNTCTPGIAVESIQIPGVCFCRRSYFTEVSSTVIANFSQSRVPVLKTSRAYGSAGYRYLPRKLPRISSPRTLVKTRLQCCSNSKYVYRVYSCFPECGTLPLFTALGLSTGTNMKPALTAEVLFSIL